MTNQNLGEWNCTFCILEKWNSRLKSVSDKEENDVSLVTATVYFHNNSRGLI